MVVEEPQIERQIKDGFVYEKRRKSISIVNIPINCSQYIYLYFDLLQLKNKATSRTKLQVEKKMYCQKKKLH